LYLEGVGVCADTVRLLTQECVGPPQKLDGDLRFRRTWGVWERQSVVVGEVGKRGMGVVPHEHCDKGEL
jgi:hypothetical protein